MEEFDSIDSSWIASGAEAPSEKSEKQKESYKKAQAQLQKAQKDEKKAQWDNNDLFQILLRFIQNPYYEELVPVITSLLQLSVPARYIIATIALFYPEATLHMLTSIGKKDDIATLLAIHHYPEEKEFDESELDPSIRTWMSMWVVYSQTYVVSDHGSLIMQGKLSELLSTNPYLLEALTIFIQFFFTSRNLKTPIAKSRSYAEFLRKEYIKSLSESLNQWDKDLLSDMKDVEAKQLFWF